MPGRHQAGPAVYVGVNVPAGRTGVVVHGQPGGTCRGGTAPDHAHLGRTPCTLVHFHLNLPSLQQRQQPRSPAAKGMNLFPKVSGPAASGLLEMPRRPGDSLRERVGEAAPDPGVSRPAEPDCRRPPAAREGVPTPLAPARGGGHRVGRAKPWQPRAGSPTTHQPGPLTLVHDSVGRGLRLAQSHWLGAQLGWVNAWGRGEAGALGGLAH